VAVADGCIRDKAEGTERKREGEKETRRLGETRREGEKGRRRESKESRRAMRQGKQGDKEPRSDGRCCGVHAHGEGART
jgi:hypothetical protein